MAKLSTAELIESFKEMPLIELSEFVKLLPLPAAALPLLPRSRSRTSSTSSSRRPAKRRSRSSRRSARSRASG